MTEQEDALAGRGFGRAAHEYVAGRPDYPVDAVAWLIGDARRVLDVGAGTGKLTAAVVALGRETTAVEPDAGMLAARTQEVPTARALQGAAEALPVPASSADAILFGQAWHWVDVPAATAEAARVLVPGGTLGLIWNMRDSNVPWVRLLGAIMHGSEAERAIRAGDIRVDPPFPAPEQRSWRWVRPMTPDQLVAMAASRSYVIALEPAERNDLLREVRALIDTHPDTAGRARIDMPYTTEAFRTRLPSSS